MQDLDFRQMREWMPWALEIGGMVSVWARAFDVPEETINRQINFAYGWSLSNKKKAPKKNVIRFLWSWLKRSYEYGNLKRKPENYKEKENEGELVTGDDWAKLRQAI